jgi:outer membrane protein TolC
LSINTANRGHVPVGIGLVGFLILTSGGGCGHTLYGDREDLARRILAPPTSHIDEDLPTPRKEEISPPKKNEAPNDKPTTIADLPKPGADTRFLDQSRLAGPIEAVSDSCGPGQTLTLSDAIALAFQLQPRLKASLERIQQARGREDVALAAFLPIVSSAYSVGGFALDAGGAPFTFIPFTGALPLGLDVHTGYELAELRLQWLVCDFGRRLGRYKQAELAADMAQLQTQRAYQTIADEVAAAYYQVLRAQSLHRIAVESVRRAQDDLDVARKLVKGGVVEREKVLRAEVALAQAQRADDVSEESEAVAVAALNLAIGLNVSAPTGVVDIRDVPSIPLGLADCLQAAVSGRREFQVARQSVQVAYQGSRVARADFAPRIVAEGYLNDFQQASPRGHANLGLGFIKLEWGLFEGGKRVAELRVADSHIREAMAEAESIADTIAFQVNQAYRQMVAARKGIDRSRPAVDQAQETYRLVVARSRQGDATPAELTDAQTELTRAEQDYANAVYDYLTAVERLEYVMGTTATPLTPGWHAQSGSQANGIATEQPSDLQAGH